MKKNKLAKSAVFITMLLFCSKGLGFVREIFLAYKFGTSYIVDAYTVSITLPSVVFTVFASGFSQSYIPVYSRVKESKERKYFFSNLTNILLIISIFICICCFLGSDMIVSCIAPGFDLKTKELTVFFIKIISLIFPVMTVFNLLSAHLATSEDFIFANFCDYIIINVVLIISICFATQKNSWVLAIGYVISMLFALMLLLGYALKLKKVFYKPYIKIRDSSLKLLCKMAIPLGLSLLVNQLNTVVDRIFSSTLGEGVTSSLNYADKIQSIFLTLTTSIFLSVCYPRINKYFAINDKRNGMYYIKKAFSIALYTSIPLVAILVLYCVPIVRVLFEKGAFSRESTIVTAGCLACYSIGIPFYAFREIMTKTLAANEKQKLILKNTIISVACNISFNLMLIKVLGYIGLALATSISGFITFIIMNIDLHKNELLIIDNDIVRDFLKIVVVTIISIFAGGIFTYIFHKFGIKSDILYIIGIMISGVIYVLVSLLFRIDIVYWLYDKLPDKLKIV